MKAKIKYSLGRTINTGNYENVRPEVGIELMFDCDDEEQFQKKFENVKAWVEARIKEEEMKWMA